MKPFDFHRQFQVLPQPHAIFSRDLKFVAVNAAMETSSGLPAAKLIGQGLFDMFPDSGVSGERLRASLDRVVETGERSSVAFLRYDIPNPDAPDGDFLTRYWSLTYSPILDEAGNTEFILATIIDVTQIAEENERAVNRRKLSLPAQNAVVENAKDVEEAYAETASEINTFRRLFRQAPGMFAVLEGPDLRFTFVNDSFRDLACDRTLLGRPFFQALPELEGQGVSELARHCLDGGGTVMGETVRMELRRSANDEPTSEKFFDFTFSPLTDNKGAVIGLFFQGADRTQSMRATLRHRILVDELNHRVKNTLSMVQAMARQSFRSARDPEEARYAFEARIMALSQAHNILSARRWESAGLTTLLHQELVGLPADRISVSGPNVLLGSKAAIALAMVFHELTSNAVRYGALASDDGTLQIEWDCDLENQGRLLRLSWAEATPGTKPVMLREGYGIRVLRRVIEGELGGDLTLEIGPDGLICQFDIMMSGVGEFETSAA
ncbi:PAS domain-containing protein [Fulvimarina sp. 2208YS6-2-32]|uniref:Blue-light-activated histidine kinase n=1 Tax=Fulvimarina uroteuthidis TaxID=3098149 RepID=A0ABU5I4G1_9HYPH|nr:PAS domain-containing protein [Fulvimarina sp. 2208YS6-2-32]MDY8109977.1 PAS domain-containing protein [Fulvimarina sp. 2208YS6-2-32]